MKSAVAASALLLGGAWHTVGVSKSPSPRVNAGVAKVAIQNVHSLGLRVSAEGHPHVAGTVTCTHGARHDYYGWDYDVQVVAIHRLAVRVPLPATCSVRSE